MQNVIHLSIMKDSKMKTKFLATIISIIFLSSAQPMHRSATCPISQTTAICSSIALTGASGFFAYKGATWMKPHYSSTTHNACGLVTGLIVGGMSYELLSRLTPEYNYQQAKNIILTASEDKLFGQKYSIEDFHKEVSARFTLSAWPLADAYDYLFFWMQASKQAQKIALAIIQECPGYEYESLRQECQQLLDKLQPWAIAAQKQLNTITEHKDYSFHRRQQNESGIRNITSQVVDINNLQIVGSSLKIVSLTLDIIRQLTRFFSHE